MEKLFENEDIILSSTGRDYDFVGIIETKGDEPLTFFFSEELCESIDEADDYESDVDENKTELLDVYRGMSNGEDDSDNDEEQETADSYMAANNFDHVSYFRTRDDKSTGFLSDPQERGQFLALIKAYCPEKLNCLPWVENGQSVM